MMLTNMMAGYVNQEQVGSYWEYLSTETKEKNFSQVGSADAKSVQARIAAIENKLIRSSCVNNVVSGFAVLSEYAYHRQLAHMIRFTGPFKEWQGGLQDTYWSVV